MLSEHQDFFNFLVRLRSTNIARIDCFPAYCSERVTVAFAYRSSYSLNLVAEAVIGIRDVGKTKKRPDEVQCFMNEMFDSADEKFLPGNHPAERNQNNVASAISSWKENLKDNLFIVLLGSVAVSFLAGYFIAQQQEARKRDQWAEILFRQAKHWVTDRGRETASSVKQGLEYARSAAEQGAERGAEYSHRLNPFHRERRHRFLGII